MGEAVALLSPKSKVLGAVSRTRSPGSRGHLLRAGLRLRGDTRRPAPARSLPPPRQDECASGLGEAAAPWTRHEEEEEKEEQTPGPGARWRPGAPAARAALGSQASALRRPARAVPATRLSHRRLSSSSSSSLSPASHPPLASPSTSSAAPPPLGRSAPSD